MRISDQAIEELLVAEAGLSVGGMLLRRPEWARRTLSRRLAALIDEGRVEASGAGPSRRYRWLSAGTRIAAGVSVASSVSETSEPRRSPAAMEVIRYVQRPVHERAPVGYQADFLLDYAPNDTFYLSPSHRAQLHAIGRTPALYQPAGTYGRAVLNRLLIDLSWASSHLEGNTYSRLDTVELIEAGKVAEGRDVEETQMILNHKYAIEMLVDDAPSLAFNRYTVMNVHGALSENLLTNPADEGRLRQSAVEVSGSAYRPLDTPQQIEEYFDICLEKAGQIQDPFEQSFFAMVHIAYLQPFADANKRTSRILANVPLIKANLCPLTFKDVPVDAYSDAILGVYEMTRVDALRDLYLWAYERSAQEFIAIHRDTVKPDPTRLRYRDLIKSTVADVVRNPDADALSMIATAVRASASAEDVAAVESAINDELARLHEGVLARYGLRPNEYYAWKNQ